jgi:carbon-monoxide dehydrogenase medium subunit
VKPAPFRYEVPDSLEEAVWLLAEHGDEARVLAGGQSLVPAMNLRIVRPTVVVDINRIPGADALNVDDGFLRAGPLVRHATLEAPPIAGPAGALVSQAAHLIAHPPIRTRGTMLGSLAFADPAAEWCVVAQLFDAEVTARSKRGDRTVGVNDLLADAFMNSLQPDELLVEARLHVPGHAVGAAIVEQSHTEGDFAVVLAAALLVKEGNEVRHRVAVGGAAPTARRFAKLEDELDRQPSLRNDIEAIRELMRDAIDPRGDLYGSPGYRAHLAAVLTSRALERAAA